jgi:hypothetical protein
MIRTSTAIFVCLVAALSTHAQVVGGRSLVVEEFVIPGMPALQSFAWGQHEGQWFLIGGRTDGLHRRQPPVAFLASGNNINAYVVDPVTAQVWSAPLTGLSPSLQEQLQSTNMEFDQRDGTLYCVGGYGYSPTAQDHITYPYLTAVDLPGVMDAIRNGEPIASFFRQVQDDRMAVTGGQMRLLDGWFNVVGGQRFIGRYNPMGPDFGPGFFQEYTNAVRRFHILDDGMDLAIADLWERVDTLLLHRRDYNMLPQVFPDGEVGLTVFSGVFQYADDIPWLNTVDIRDTVITEMPGFQQMLNQYHGAHAGVHNAASNIMRSLFFGGISRYYFDDAGTLWDDPNVPFVRTISLVQRDAAGAMSEAQVGLMPGLLGASAEFIPWPGTPQDENSIFLEDAFQGDTVVLGHIAGGIESSAANIFFVNNGVESAASPRVFRVLLVDPLAAVKENAAGLSTLDVVNDGGMLHITASVPDGLHGALRIVDALGREVRALPDRLAGHAAALTIDARGLKAGAYALELRAGRTTVVKRFVR